MTHNTDYRHCTMDECKAMHNNQIVHYNSVVRMKRAKVLEELEERMTRTQEMNEWQYIVERHFVFELLNAMPGPVDDVCTDPDPRTCCLA